MPSVEASTPELTSLPSRAQTALLRAALVPGPRAAAAFQEWSGMVDFDRMDAGSQRLMPLVVHNLRGLDFDHPLLPRMRGLQRWWWSKNSMLLHGLPGVLDLLARASIQPMVLKGVPLAVSYYDNPGLRPMSDLDLLVPTADASRAFAVLLENGWRFNEPDNPPYRNDGSLNTYERPGYGFANSRGLECDLHWHMLHDGCWEGADEGYRARAVEIRIGGAAAWAPSPADLLLHVCAHGSMYNRMPTLRWIADATVIMRSARERIDWDLLIDHAHERLLIVVLRKALECVAAISDERAPEAVRRRLQRLRVSYAERREYDLRLRDANYLRTLTGRRCQFRRRFGHVSLARRLYSLPGYCQAIWSVSNPRDLPWHIVSVVLPAYLARVLPSGPARGESSR